MGGWSSGPACSLAFNWRYLIIEISVRIFLASLIVGFSFIKPFERQVYGDDWYDHYYPYVEPETFPEGTSTVILASCAIIIPVLVLALFFAWKKMPKRLVAEEVLGFFLGLALAGELNFAVTELVKNLYGRPRPDYLSRCFGNDKSKWQFKNVAEIPPIPNCVNPNISVKHLRDGRKSFPSAHSSIAFSVYVYLALFIYRKLCQVKNTGSLRLVVPCIPLLFASYIAISRTQDYRHFPTDVLAGILLGSTFAYVVWRFYDGLMLAVYNNYRVRYAVMAADAEGIVHDPYNLQTPAMILQRVNNSKTTVGEDSALPSGNYNQYAMQDMEMEKAETGDV